MNTKKLTYAHMYSLQSADCGHNIVVGVSSLQCTVDVTVVSTRHHVRRLKDGVENETRNLDSKLGRFTALLLPQSAIFWAHSKSLSMHCQHCQTRHPFRSAVKKDPRRVAASAVAPTHRGLRQRHGGRVAVDSAREGLGRAGVEGSSLPNSEAEFCVAKRPMAQHMAPCLSAVQRNAKQCKVYF